ncbi:MAG: aliphatic sulfonate ABC transporter substrate-binding protein [Methylobacteriaceae bacterium]|nr:aliphatic sulfonate ABC transporter substrate-binding protein [Methylobacteriaceae bacterium]
MADRQIDRRALLAGLAAAPLLARGAVAQDAPRELRVGYQKTGMPVVAKGLGVIEKHAAAEGASVRWVEFTAGPPLLEAMNVGSVDIGYTGDTPPIFAQSAGAAITYVAAMPSNARGEGLIARKDSGIAQITDLRGRKVGFTKGSSAHNLTVAALEKAGVSYADIQPVFLSPADASAAFARGSIDAWTIWDPFFAVAQARYEPVLLTTSKDVLRNNTFMLANRGFAAKAPKLVNATLAALREAATWADANRHEVAKRLAEVTGVEIGAQTVAADRAEFGVFPVSPEIVAHQQESADRLHKLGLIPRAIAVRDAIWTPPQS